MEENNFCRLNVDALTRNEERNFMSFIAQQEIIFHFFWREEVKQKKGQSHVCVNYEITCEC